MTRLLFVLFVALTILPVEAARASSFVSRRDGFLLIWRSISRVAEVTKEKPYTDVPSGSDAFREITYSKARGLLPDTEKFMPDEPLTPAEAFLWLLRTRSSEPLSEEGTRIQSILAEEKDASILAEKYGIDFHAEGQSMTQEDLLSMMSTFDAALRNEDHEVSLYAEKFHGDGTAFGETFDMYALTAAHRTYPYNTLVRVTNIENGKSVTVRINDRGPFISGRDMDLSLASFTSIAERSRGKIRATFERLGDVNLVYRCKDDRFQSRIGKVLKLLPGIPHNFPLGARLRLRSESPFVVRDVQFPDGTRRGEETWITGEEIFEFAPSVVGTYRFIIGTKEGRRREMAMEVVDCTSLSGE